MNLEFVKFPTFVSEELSRKTEKVGRDDVKEEEEKKKNYVIFKRDFSS